MNNAIQYPIDKTAYVAIGTKKHNICWQGVNTHPEYDSFLSASEKAINIISNWEHYQAKVSHPWLIDENGAIYSIYPDYFWSYHTKLGKKKLHVDKQTVSIAVVLDKDLELTPQQETSLVELSGDICNRHKMPRSFCMNNKEIYENIHKKVTVFCHSSCHTRTLGFNISQPLLNKLDFAGFKLI